MEVVTRQFHSELRVSSMRVDLGPNDGGCNKAIPQ